MTRQEAAELLIGLVNELEFDDGDVEAALRFWAGLRRLGGPEAVQASRWRAGAAPLNVPYQGPAADAEAMLVLMESILDAVPPPRAAVPPYYVTDLARALGDRQLTLTPSGSEYTLTGRPTQAPQGGTGDQA